MFVRLSEHWAFVHGMVGAVLAPFCCVLWHGFQRLLLVALFSFCLFSPVAAKVVVDHEAKEMRGFARIVLNFERLPAYESTVDDTILVFRFPEPVSLNFSQLVAKLPNYLGVARVDPDGRAFRLAFVDRFKVNIMEAGTKVFIDILGRDWKGMPPNLPQDVVRAITKRAKEIEAENRERARQRAKAKDTYKAKIRVGALPTFSRLVFDWNKFVTARLERQDQIVTLTFGQPVPLDVGRVKHNLPKYLLDISANERDAETVVTMKLQPKAFVRGYREGNDYVVDVSPSDVALSDQLKKLEKSIVDDEGNEVGRSEVRLFSDGGKEEKMNEFSARSDRVELMRSTYSAFNPDEFDLNKFGDRYEEAGVPNVRFNKPDARRVWQQRIGQRRPLIEPVVQDAGLLDRSRPWLKTLDGTSEIGFPFSEVVPAVGFIRDDTIWIVFDSFQEIDLSNVMAAKADQIKAIRKTKLHNGQLILIKLKQPMLFAFEYDNLTWKAKIGDMVTAKADALRLRRKKSADTNRHYVSIAMERPSHVYWLRDETIGDRIGLVTSYPPVGQLTKPQNFVEFSTFGTAHSIAILPKTDDVEIRVGFQEVMISRNHGLHLSDENQIAKEVRAPRVKRALAEDVGFINFDQWKQGGNGSFVDQMGGFETRIALAEDALKYEARRDYARFLLANELGLETLGMIERIVSETPERQNDPEVRMLQAAANVLSRRPEDAIKALSIGALYNNEHAALWRGMAKMMMEQWSDALRQMRSGEDVLEFYPDVYRARFALGAAKAALALKHYDVAEKYLNSVSSKTGEKEIDVQNMLLNAEFLAAKNALDEAERLYEIVGRSDVAPAVARANLDLLKLRLNNNKLTAEEALPRLEGMQLMWRGDETELAMLSMLSKLYAQKGDYRLAFANMKQAVKAFPADDGALQIQDDMAKVFKSLFLQNQVTSMRPIEALSLFYDFKELTPVGRTGDEMIRMLADRLIDVDLLDHAAELLDHQVRNRVNGAARSQVAAKLAMVHLMNRKPALALQTIGRTRQPNLPKQITRARDILEARSLSELGQVDGAIDILNRMNGSEIERMKADAYWNAQQWDKAGEQLEKILGTSWNAGGALAPYQRQDVLRSAISYSLAQDAFALSRLRKKFYNKMVNSEDASAFIVVTKPVKKDGEAYKRLAKDIAAINTLDTFMKQYRDFYKDSLSADGTAGEDLSSGPSKQDG